MKLLLVYAPFCTPATPPYSLAKLHAFLRDNYNGEIDVLDLNIEFHKKKFKDFAKFLKQKDQTNYKEEAKQFLQESGKIYSTNNKAIVNDEKPELFDDMYNEIIKKKPDVVAFSVVYSSQCFYAYSLIKKLRENNIKVIIGGPAVNKKLMSVAKHLNNEVELLEYLNNEKLDCSKLKVRNIIDFNIFKLKDYFTEEIVLPIKTTSSCYYQQCTFCTHHNKSMYFEYNLDDIKETLKGAKKVFIIDDMIHKKRLLEIAKIMKKLKIEWMCQLRPTKEFDKKTLKELYESGLKIIVWGVESGNDRILKLMKKGTNVKDNEIVLKNSKDVGIKNVLYTMFGFPSETKEEFLETIEFLKRNEENIDLISTSVFGLQPGTEIYKNPEKFGINKISEKTRTILAPKISYEVSKGLTQTKAKELIKKYKKTLEKINKFPKEMNFFRVHMLNEDCL